MDRQFAFCYEMRNECFGVLWYLRLVVSLRIVDLQRETSFVRCLPSIASSVSLTSNARNARSATSPWRLKVARLTRTDKLFMRNATSRKSAPRRVQLSTNKKKQINPYAGARPQSPRRFNVLTCQSEHRSKQKRTPYRAYTRVRRLFCSFHLNHTQALQLPKNHRQSPSRPL
jgi:hypothetical protein